MTKRKRVSVEPDRPEPFFENGTKRYICHLCPVEPVGTNVKSWANRSKHMRDAHAMSTQKKGKPGPRIRCPYCTTENYISLYMRKNHFQRKHADLGNIDLDVGLNLPRLALNNRQLGGDINENSSSSSSSSESSGDDSIRDDTSNNGSPQESFVEDVDENEGQKRSYIAEYTHRMRASHVKALTEMEERVRQHQDESTRMGRELPDYKTRFEGCRMKAPLTLEEYELAEPGEIEDGFFLILMPSEARELISKAPLRVPVLIPAAWAKEQRPLLILEQYVKKLELFGKIAAHDFTRHSEVSMYPELCEAVEVGRRIRERDGTINLLDLGLEIPNSVPDCLVGQPGWDVLPTLRAMGAGRAQLDGGKQALTTSLSWQLLATAGAFSQEHIDRHGVITSVRVEAGEKLWLAWPWMDQRDFQSWISSGELDRTPFLILMEEGDTLIQPSGTVHAPFTSGEVTLMTGNMFWDTRDMGRIAMLWWLESICNYSITNEAQASDFHGLMHGIKALHDDHSEAFPWSEDERAQFDHCIRMLIDDEPKYCDCKSGKCTNCRCQKAGRMCNFRCHRSCRNAACTRQEPRQSHGDEVATSLEEENRSAYEAIVE